MFLSEWREFSFGALPCRGEKKIDDGSRLVVEIAHVPDMLPSLFPSQSGQGLISTPVSLWVFQISGFDNSDKQR